ncbi:hypothetical protein HK098_002362 [Nowakowskiella sp. JEL0407]|nr:hypothetical protein HK098_002362 [Nowakowskiella sp. JEL0407]
MSERTSLNTISSPPRSPTLTESSVDTISAFSATRPTGRMQIHPPPIETTALLPTANNLNSPYYGSLIANNNHERYSPRNYTNSPPPPFPEEERPQFNLNQMENGYVQFPAVHEEEEESEQQDDDADGHETVVEREDVREEDDDDFEDGELECWGYFPCILLIIGLSLTWIAIWPLIPTASRRVSWLTPGERAMYSFSPYWYKNVSVSLSGINKSLGDDIEDDELSSSGIKNIRLNSDSVYADVYLVENVLPITKPVTIKRRFYPILTDAYRRPPGISEYSFIRIDNLAQANLSVSYEFKTSLIPGSSLNSINDEEIESKSFVNIMVLKSDDTFSLWNSGIPPPPSLRIVDQRQIKFGSLNFELRERDTFYLIFYVSRRFFGADSDITVANGTVVVNTATFTYDIENQPFISKCRVNGSVLDVFSSDMCNFDIPENVTNSYILYSTPQCPELTSIDSRYTDTCPQLRFTLTTQLRDDALQSWWPLWLLLFPFLLALGFITTSALIQCFCPCHRSLQSRGFGRFNPVRIFEEEEEEALPVYTPPINLPENCDTPLDGLSTSHIPGPSFVATTGRRPLQIATYNTMSEVQRPLMLGTGNQWASPQQSFTPQDSPPPYQT